MCLFVVCVDAYFNFEEPFLFYIMFFGLFAVLIKVKDNEGSAALSTSSEFSFFLADICVQLECVLMQFCV